MLSYFIYHLLIFLFIYFKMYLCKTQGSQKQEQSNFNEIVKKITTTNNPLL